MDRLRAKAYFNSIGTEVGRTLFTNALNSADDRVGTRLLPVVLFQPLSDHRFDVAAHVMASGA
ncbi:hypothetical protein [Actinoplanes sichuanensis]|uniref:hypothetical protein n=1 Tax=Actinoplanes sichuanensis TaxID=512349 RepID=UPI002955BD67|nr:hypothetical protein [Actinoplanes sichuanensis]